MAIFIEGPDGEREWTVRVAPQCMTDLLVQVMDAGQPDMALFAFKLGELIREEVEADGALDGRYVAEPSRRAELARWATLLDIHARTIRAVLAVSEPPDRA